MLALTLLITVITACKDTKNAGDASVPTTSAASAESTAKVEGPSPEPAKEIKLSYATWDYGDRKKMNDAIAQTFKDKLNITLEIVNYPTAEYITIIQTKVAAQDAPDLIHIHGSGSGYGKTFVENGELLPVNNEPGLANYSPDYLETCKSVVDGKIYAVESTTNVIGAIYKKKLFADMGLSVPTCYDEFIDICEKLKAKNIIPLMGGFKEDWTTQMLTHQSINQCLGEAGKTSKLFEKAELKFSDPLYKKALGYFEDFVKKGYYGPKPLAIDAATASILIAQGKAGILIQGNWQLADIRKTDKDGEYGFFAVPFNKKGETQYITASIPATGSGGIAIYAKGKNIEAAKKAFNLFHSDADLQTTIVTEMGGMPTNKLAKVTDPFIKEVIAAFNSGKPMCFPDFYNSQPVNDAYTKGLQAIAAGADTVDGVTARMDKMKEIEIKQASQK